jgi:hypothetical protein
LRFVLNQFIYTNYFTMHGCLIKINIYENFDKYLRKY